MKPFWLLLALAAAALAWRWTSGGRTARALLGLATIALAVVGSGVVALPSVEELVDGVGTRLGRWTYLLVGVNAFLETGAFLGFIAPGETLVLFGGVLAGAGTIELVPLILIVWGCAVAGDMTSYVLGRRYGRAVLLRFGARVKIGEPQVQFVERFFERHGMLTVFLGRWVGVVRPLVPFLAGSTRLPFTRFALIDVTAALLWSAALSVLGSIFWQNFEQLTQLVSQALFVLGAVVVIGAGLGFAITARRSPRRSAAVRAWIVEHQAEHSVLAGPAAAAWRFVSAVERHAPGRRSRRPAADETGTVRGDATPSGRSSAPDPPAEP